MVKPSILSSFRSFTSSYSSSHHSHHSSSTNSSSSSTPNPVQQTRPTVETFGTSTTITAARSIVSPKAQTSVPPVYHYYSSPSNNMQVVIPDPPPPPPKGPTIAQRRPLMTMKSLPQITETRSAPLDEEEEEGLLTPKMLPRPGSAASFISTTTVRTIDLENFVAGLEYDSDDDTISMYGASIYEESIFGDEHDGRNSPTIWTKRAERVLQGAKKKLDNYGQSLNLTPEEMSAGIKASRAGPIQRPAALSRPIPKYERTNAGKRTSSSAMGMHSQRVPTSAHFRASSESAVPTLYNNGTNGNGDGHHLDARGSKSTEQMRVLRDQMKDLRGKISHLQQQTRTDSLRRRSISSLRSTSSAQGVYPNPDVENRPDSAAWNNDISHQQIIEEESEVEEVDEIIPTKLTPPPTQRTPRTEVRAETSTLEEDSDDDDDDDDDGYDGHSYLDERYEAQTPAPEMMSGLEKRVAESRPSTPEYSSDDASFETASNGSGTPKATVFRESCHEDREDAFKYDSLFVNGVFASIKALRERPLSYSSISSTSSQETVISPSESLSDGKLEKKSSLKNSIRDKAKVDLSPPTRPFQQPIRKDSLSSIASFATAQSRIDSPNSDFGSPANSPSGSALRPNGRQWLSPQPALSPTGDEAYHSAPQTPRFPTLANGQHPSYDRNPSPNTPYGLRPSPTMHSNTANSSYRSSPTMRSSPIMRASPTLRASPTMSSPLTNHTLYSPLRNNSAQTNRFPDPPSNRTSPNPASPAPIRTRHLEVQSPSKRNSGITTPLGSIESTPRSPLRRGNLVVTTNGQYAQEVSLQLDDDDAALIEKVIEKLGSTCVDMEGCEPDRLIRYRKKLQAILRILEV